MPQYELNLRDYWVIIQKRRFVILILTIAVLIGSVLYTQTLPYVYRATATVRIKEQRTVSSMITQLATGRVRDPLGAYDSMVTSQAVMERVVLELGMVGEFASQSEIASNARSLRGAVTTQAIEGANIIIIKVEYGESNTAANIANKITSVFIEENLREKNKQARQVREFIEKQVEEITTKLKESEDKFKEFKETEFPSGIAVPLQNRLANLEDEKMELLRQYTELHPDIININQNIASLQEQIGNLPQKELEYARLSREVELQTRLYTDFKTRLEAAKIAEAEQVEDVVVVDPAIAPHAPISPNKKLNTLFGLALGALLGFVGAVVVEQLDTSIGTIEDVETYLKLPVLGVVPYLKVEGEQMTLLSKLWPKQYKGKEKLSRLQSQLMINYPLRSAIVEAYKVIRTNIQMEIFKSEIKKKVLLISSSGPEEGKTLTISNLAIAFAESGNKVLLIDADLRRASIHKIFGIKNKAPGLTDILRGTHTIDTAARSFADAAMGDLNLESLLNTPGIDNLHILPCGSSPSAPAEILGAEELKKLLLNLRERYDIILIDSPPILAVTDPIILAPLADAIILVYKVGKTARIALMRAKMQLENVKAPCKGVILNNISPEIEMRTTYYYHYRYYGEKKEKKEEGSGESA